MLVRTGLATATAVALLWLGGALRPAPSSPASTAPAPAGAAAAVRELEGRVRRSPADTDVLAQLGLAYQQRAQESGDPADYTRADAVLRRARRLAPRDADVIAALGALALSRHRFGDALRLGRRARALSPGTAHLHGLVGDAQLELGRYAQAFAAYDRFAAARPGLAAYARVAQGRRLVGDTAGAAGAYRLALAAALGQGEPEAWVRVQLGGLLLSSGRVQAASAQLRAALAAMPGYPAALDGLAMSEWARGRMRQAISFARRAVAASGEPAFVELLGDLLRAAGDERGAREQYARVQAIERREAASGVRTELEAAEFRADHGIAPAATVALARRARRARPSIEGDEILAWALARAGRCAEARAHSARGLRLGTRDALAYFRRAMIERCLGRPSAARAWARRAIAIDPRFSVRWAPVAERLAATDAPPPAPAPRAGRTRPDAGGRAG